MNTNRAYTNNNYWGSTEFGEVIHNIILNHNKAINALYTLNFKISENQVLTGMGLWNNLAIEGSYIVTMARAHGINVKVNMQDGKITYQHFSTFYEVCFENQTRMIIRSGDDKLDIKTAEAFLKEDIANCGEIVDIIPITIEEASKKYDFNNYHTWPLIG